jgi:hypothetical protein
LAAFLKSSNIGPRSARKRRAKAGCRDERLMCLDIQY